MNKAFVKEPEQAEPRCPATGGCEGLGAPVTRTTLLAHLSEDTARSFAEASYYCGNPKCEVVYFDAWGTTALRSAVKGLGYPKDPAAPICPCFGITAQEIREDAEGGRKDRVRDLLAKAESPDARCRTASSSGASCVVEVRRLFLKYFPSQ